MNGFTEEVSEALKAYVYRLEDPRTGRTFYVGKGRGDRVFAHARLAIAGEEGLRYDQIREIRLVGLEPRIVIHRHGLDDLIALEIEAALIDAYPADDLGNEVRGHGQERGTMTVEEVTEAYGAQPAEVALPSILIKIERQWQRDLTPEQLYERTRRYWICNPERQPRPPQYALAIARGLIREVFEIESWEDYPNMAQEALDPTRLPQEQSAALKRGQARKGFIGRVTRDDAMRQRLVGRSVRHIPFGVGNPIAYVGCGRRRREARD